VLLVIGLVLLTALVGSISSLLHSITTLSVISFIVVTLHSSTNDWPTVLVMTGITLITGTKEKIPCSNIYHDTDYWQMYTKKAKHVS